MPVDHVAKDGEGSHAIDEHALAKHLLAHVSDQDMRNDADARNDGNVDLRMTEKPHEVINHAHAVSGRRIRLIPLTRRSSVVVMKFSAPNNWPMQKRAIEVAQRTTPRPCPGPPAVPIALSGAYWVQPPKVGPSARKKEDIRTTKARKVTQKD